MGFEEEVREEGDTVPLGKAAIEREISDVTIVAVAWMVT